MAVWIWDKIGKHVTIQSISRALASVGWSRKTARQIAKEQTADLRGFFLYHLTVFQSNQLIFVDKLGCDKKAGFRSTDCSGRS